MAPWGRYALGPVRNPMRAEIDRIDVGRLLAPHFLPTFAEAPGPSAALARLPVAARDPPGRRKDDLPPGDVQDSFDC